MNVLSTKFDKVKLIEPIVHGDHRGFFMESYNKKIFAQANIDVEFVQDNHSLSVEAGVIRGLHFQTNPYAQAKLVRVISGEILDVVVDLRQGSPTFGQWESYVLSAQNKKQLFVPAGFAHGFCTLVANTEIQYKVDQYYAPEYDSGIAWNDPQLAINWPTHKPILSDKDRKLPFMKDSNFNFIYEGVDLR